MVCLPAWAVALAACALAFNTLWLVALLGERRRRDDNRPVPLPRSPRPPTERRLRG